MVLPPGVSPRTSSSVCSRKYCSAVKGKERLSWVYTFWLERFEKTSYAFIVFFWFKRVLDWGPEQRESNLTVLSPLIIIILISYITIIKLLIMENHPSRNQKRNSAFIVGKTTCHRKVWSTYQYCESRLDKNLWAELAVLLLNSWETAKNVLELSLN